VYGTFNGNTTGKYTEKISEHVRASRKGQRRLLFSSNAGCGTAHEYTQKELLAMIRTIEVEQEQQ